MMIREFKWAEVSSRSLWHRQVSLYTEKRSDWQADFLHQGPKRLRQEINYLQPSHRPQHKTNQGPQRAIFSYHLSSEHNIQPRGQISQWRGGYVKILWRRWENWEEASGLLQASEPMRISWRNRDEPVFLLQSKVSSNSPSLINYML